ncbi:proline-, glutamic acid- and leucine-rich protein 1-like [Oscarella lobularis]|uniref:proline-, glutamic acid- and leucine-rich protein 1-like n=1 Tax=Oscarella lobularis TaxID=121494 RepID=UPI00331381DE
MDFFQSYFQELFERSDRSSVQIDTLLRQIRDFSSVSEEWIAFLNSVSLAKALPCLEITARNCSTTQMADSALSWLQKLISMLQQQNRKQRHDNAAAATKLISLILHYVHQLPDLCRTFVSEHLQDLLQILIEGCRKAERNALVFFQCLESCLVYLPGPMTMHRSKLEPCFLQHSTSNDDEIIKAGARCLALVSLSSGSSSQKQGAELWTQMCRKAINTLKRLCRLVNPQRDEDLGDSDGILLPLEDIPSTQPAIIGPLIQQSKFSTQLLANLLCGDYPATTVAVPIDDILHLLSSEMIPQASVDLQQSSAGVENIAWIAVLPSFYSNVLSILINLIRSCNQSLLRYAKDINTLFIRIFSWTNRNRLAERKYPRSDVRIKAYDVLLEWLAVIGSGLDVNVTERLIQQMLDDVRPQLDNESDKVSASIENEDSSLSRKKRKRKRREEILSSLSNTGRRTKRHFGHNSALCQTALESLGKLIIACGPLMSVRSLNSVGSFVSSLLVQCQRSSVVSHCPSLPLQRSVSLIQPPDPYWLSSCRCAAYKLLKSCLLSGNQLANPFPLQNAVRVFSVGLKDPSAEVVLACQESLSICEVLLHPRMPPLKLPRQVVQEEESSEMAAVPTPSPTPLAQLIVERPELDEETRSPQSEQKNDEEMPMNQESVLDDNTLDDGDSGSDIAEEPLQEKHPHFQSDIDCSSAEKNDQDIQQEASKTREDVNTEVEAMIATFVNSDPDPS